ncbi:hypothetical protein F6V30_08945 [Oryzomonas sagensis]|uniref:Uncharacterized protein n=1 Tax=Oryzomonas sagensis TaxID=2603857 RepID=A0ABQ6TNN7_9BACT|nr:hypothetical protein [Oryzomonas sagensis]KAB0670272.1 hypothetical protein F6V30_08945 [Oryzomonas sagensis]
MATEDSYGICFFAAGKYHILCREGKGYRFQNVAEYSGLTPVRLPYHEARAFIESHPICANISLHGIRIMPYGEVENILQGKSAASAVKSLALSGEEEEEKPLH